MAGTCDGYQGSDCENEATVELTIEHGLGSRTEQYCSACGGEVESDVSAPQSDERILEKESL